MAKSATRHRTARPRASKEAVPQRPRIGILPLYIALYDEVRPDCRPVREQFARDLAKRLDCRGLDVALARVCCVRKEVERELKALLAKKIDLLATLHLAYSPSLESAEPIAQTDLPLVLLDTTGAATFDEHATMDDMFHNHGIHGVQDLASVLRRLGRAYYVLTGHAEDETFLDEVVVTVRAARAAAALRRCKTIVVGEPFVGMGDFAVDFAELKDTLGPDVRRAPIEELAASIKKVSKTAIEAETRVDAERFDTSGVPQRVLRESNRVGLGLRALLKKAGANAFSMNFQSFSRRAGTPTVPFLEASKAMSRGIGYSGEGDALTASFIAALMAGFGDATFTEMFCPDWRGGSIFMSHMGECNFALAAHKPRIVEKSYGFGDVQNPAVAVFRVRPGAATLVNIAPAPEGTYCVITSRVEVLDRGMCLTFPDVPHFWVRPEGGDVRAFLRRYSEWGGTHHLALLPDDQQAGIERLAAMLGLEFAAI